MREPRLAKMHLSVDDAWQNMQACRIYDLSAETFVNVAYPGDPATPYADIGEAFAGMIDDGASLQHEVKDLGQVLRLRLLLRALARSHKCREPW
jgi:hypothetical protein